MIPNPEVGSTSAVSSKQKAEGRRQKAEGGEQMLSILTPDS
jgi:hypothetical protein